MVFAFWLKFFSRMLLKVAITTALFGASVGDTLTDILQQGVIDKVYPGAVAMVGRHDKILYTGAVGKYSYDDEYDGIMTVCTQICFYVIF